MQKRLKKRSICAIISMLVSAYKLAVTALFLFFSVCMDGYMQMKLLFGSKRTEITCCFHEVGKAEHDGEGHM